MLCFPLSLKLSLPGSLLLVFSTIRLTKQNTTMNMDTRPEPCLVPSLTEDDEDAPILDGHEALIRKLREGGENKEAMSFLLRYESMVRQQEAEDMATLEYLRPCLERLEELAGITKRGKPSDKKKFSSWSVAESTLLTREISFSALKKVVELLEEKTALTEHMLADRQLMMVLKLLTQKSTSQDDPSYDENDEAVITWVEIFQAYKTCITGMFALQHLPHDHFIRARTRDRTMALLSLFQGPACKVFAQESSPTVDSSPLTHEAKRPGAFKHTSPPGTNKILMLVSMALMLIAGGVTGFLFGAKTGQLPEVKYPQSFHWRHQTYKPAKPSSVPYVPTSTLPVMSPIMRAEIADTKTTVYPITAKKTADSESIAAVVDTRKMKTPTIVGGAFGIALSPLMLSALNILAAGVTVPSAVTATIFTAGLVTITAHIARGLFSFVQNMLHGTPGARNKK